MARKRQGNKKVDKALKGLKGSAENFLNEELVNKPLNKAMDQPKNKLKMLWETTLKAIATTAIAKVVGVLTIIASVLGVAMPIIYVGVGVTVFLGFLWYNRKKIVNAKKTYDNMTNLNKEIYRESSERQKSHFKSLDPKLKEGIEALKKADQDLSMLYDEKSNSLGVDIEDIEEIVSEGKQAELNPRMERNLSFLKNVYDMLNSVPKEIDVKQILGAEKIDHVLGNLSIRGGEMVLNGTATLFEGLGEKGGDFDNKFKRIEMQVQQQLNQKGSQKFMEDLLKAGGSEQTQLQKDFTDIALRLMNETLVCRAALNGKVYENILAREDAPVSKIELDQARELKKALSPNYQGNRCETISKILFGEEVLSSSEYRRLFVILDKISEGDIRMHIGSAENILEDNPHKLRDIINGYAYDEVGLADALNIVRNGRKFVMSDNNVPRAVEANDLRNNSPQATGEETRRRDSGIAPSPAPSVEDVRDSDNTFRPM